MLRSTPCHSMSLHVTPYHCMSLHITPCHSHVTPLHSRPLTILKALLEALIVTGHRTKDKELRNEVLIVASLIARHKKSHGFFRTTGLLELLLTYATAAETDTPTPADPHNFASVLAPDLEVGKVMCGVV